jgi:hypothetical protein
MENNCTTRASKQKLRCICEKAPSLEEADKTNKEGLRYKQVTKHCASLVAEGDELAL